MKLPIPETAIPLLDSEGTLAGWVGETSDGEPVNVGLKFNGGEILPPKGRGVQTIIGVQLPNEDQPHCYMGAYAAYNALYDAEGKQHNERQTGLNS